MGIINQGNTTAQKKSGLKLTIKDTEFIIRLLNNSNIPGVDIEQAAETLKKVKTVHKQLLDIEREL